LKKQQEARLFMAYVDWMIKGTKLGNCSCDYGCPCEFNALPTRVPCEGNEGMEIEEGYFGDVRLDGIRYVGNFHWPGPVHEGGGTYQVVVDKGASEEQVEALFKILSGEEQEPTTGFNIYGSTIEHEPNPIFADIVFEHDIEAGTGRIFVEGVCDATYRPIRNSVTGKRHRALIRLPEGFEFHEAEVVSADFKSTGVLNCEHQGRYGTICQVAYGPYGIIE
jgi:hypothetical protein